MLCIPGAGGDAGAFERLATALSNEFTVVTYDRRGNSRSPKPKGWSKTSADEQANDAVALLQALDLVPTVILSNSLGAIIALNLLIRYPQLVRGVVLNEPPMFSVLSNSQEVEASLQSSIQSAMAAGGLQSGMEAFLRLAIGSAVYDRLDPQIRERLLGNAETFFGMELGPVGHYVPDETELAAVKVQVLVLMGRDSAPPFREACTWLAKHLLCDLAEIAGGHTPQYELPEELAETVRPFLRRATIAQSAA